MPVQKFVFSRSNTTAVRFGGGTRSVAPRSVFRAVALSLPPKSVEAAVDPLAAAVPEAVEGRAATTSGQKKPTIGSVYGLIRLLGPAAVRLKIFAWVVTSWESQNSKPSERGLARLLQRVRRRFLNASWLSLLLSKT